MSDPIPAKVKPWYLTKPILIAAVTILAGIASAFGLQVDENGQTAIVNVITAIADAVVGM